MPGTELKSYLHEIDLTVGRNLRAIRRSRGLSQKQVAEAIGVTMQQFQKYETAANRLSVSRMLLVADVLNVHPSEIIGGAFEGGLAQPQQDQLQIISDSIGADPKRTVRALIELFRGLAKKGGG
ncbi:helix-turn-helix transcriptional regulator [Xinfangfangia sp. D13-10-4-6]|uniref:helix-turn-helix domain-containing protein n=1 Tax=Pseudogemmobacter hezensis TaxID=2737662 RepID=UPI0015523861|nr:helix-turn-helix transcriptional regulator [Pseudogemmobacter hezensis]NPD17463.1 helix-turn-helix transcriptional regulator [Pseudogemmobacter hezensis]